MTHVPGPAPSPGTSRSASNAAQYSASGSVLGRYVVPSAPGDVDHGLARTARHAARVELAVTDGAGTPNSCRRMVRAMIVRRLAPEPGPRLSPCRSPAPA